MHDSPDPPLTPLGDFQAIVRQRGVLFRTHPYDGDSGKYAADQLNDYCHLQPMKLNSYIAAETTRTWSRFSCPRSSL